MNINELLDQFWTKIRQDNLEIYNEAGFQHELALFLRPHADRASFKLQLERNVDFFGVKGLPKSEMDLVVFSPDRKTKHCIELKVPLQGAVPERMFQFCIDLSFLEGLKQAGFVSGTAAMVTNDKGFWSGTLTRGVYGAFRRGYPLTGAIATPVRRPGLQALTLSGSYQLVWEDLHAGWRRLVARV